MKIFKKTGSVNDGPRSGRPSISLEAVTDVERAFDHSGSEIYFYISVSIVVFYLCYIVGLHVLVY